MALKPVMMTREQMIAWLTLEGYLPINDPANGKPRFHIAFIPGRVNIIYVVRGGSAIISENFSWTVAEQGTWGVMPDRAVAELYAGAMRFAGGERDPRR